MKKVILVSSLFAAILSLSSCAKVHTCTCSVSGGGVTITTGVYQAKSNTRDAQAWCGGIQAEYSNWSCTVN